MASPMTEEQIQLCKDKLLLIQKKYKELEQAFADDEASDLEEQQSIGRLSLMESMESQKLQLQESRRREMLAEKIEGGLRRFANGSFGNCFYCEESIGFERLLANPTHTRCAKCAASEPNY